MAYYELDTKEHERRQRALGIRQSAAKRFAEMILGKAGEEELTGLLTEYHAFYALAHAGVHDHAGLRVGSVVLMPRQCVEHYVSFEPRQNALFWRAKNGVRILNRLELRPIIDALICDGAHCIEVFLLPHYEVIGLYPVHDGHVFMPGSAWHQVTTQYFVDELLPAVGTIEVEPYEDGYDEDGNVLVDYHLVAYWGTGARAVLPDDEVRGCAP